MKPFIECQRTGGSVSVDYPYISSIRLLAMSVAAARPSAVGSRLTQTTIVTLFLGSVPAKVLKPGTSPVCPYSAPNFAMPNPYCGASGCAGSVDCRLAIRLACISGSSSFPSANASTQVARSATVEMPAPAAQAHDGFSDV